MPKALKTAPKAKQKVAAKPVVISFRMTDTQYGRLKTTSDRTGVIGAKSARQFARKIIWDYLIGRLEYKDLKNLRSDDQNYA